MGTNGEFDEVPLADRIFSDFETAATLVRRGSELSGEIQTSNAAILGRISIDNIGPPDLYVASTLGDLVIGDMCVEAYKKLAIKSQIDEDLAALQRELANATQGLAVELKPREESKNPLFATYFSGGLMGSHKQMASMRRPHKARGTIHSIDLIKNTLTIHPRRFTSRNLDLGFFVTPVLDLETGAPLIEIKVREPSYRDRPSRVLADLSNIIHDRPGTITRSN